MKNSKVYLVGSGPGDVELITLKGYRLIAMADVVLYDHLIPSELLLLARSDAEVISVGKFAGRHTLPQEKINALIVAKAKEDKLVVRLKGGDPFIFGRGGEELEACVEAGIDFEVVPGITSAFAAPAYAGIPPTHRDFTPSVAVVTGHRKEGKELEIPKAGTIIFLMGVSNIQKIVDSLLGAGWASDTKIAGIENGTRYNQRLITGTLDNIVDEVKRQKLGTPAIFIVGKVVGLSEKLKWFAEKPKILLLGLHPEKYRHLGNIVHRPIIDCVGLEDYSQADAILKRLGDFDWIVFTSTNGVKFFFSRLNQTGLDTRALKTAKVASIGTTTSAALKSFGVIRDMQPELESTIGLLEEFTQLDIQNKNILLVRPKTGPSKLLDGLADAGANAEQVMIYSNIDVEPGDIDFNAIDKILFTSGSIIRGFLKHYGEVPRDIEILCLGQPTLDEATKHNIEGKLLKK